MFDIVAVVLLSFAVVLAWYSPAIARRWRLNQERRAIYANEFYDAAREVMKHEAATDDIKRIVVLMGSAMTQPGAIRSFAWQWVTGRLSPIQIGAPRSQFFADLDNAPDDLKRLTAMTMAYSLFASTYLTLFSGWLVRNFLLRPVGMPKQSDDGPKFAKNFVGSIRNGANDNHDKMVIAH